MTLFKEYKPIITPVLLDMMQQSDNSTCDPNNMPSLLNKEACELSSIVKKSTYCL